MLEPQSEFNKRITKLQDSIEKLTKAQEQKTAAEYFYIQAQRQGVLHRISGKAIMVRSFMPEMNIWMRYRVPGEQKKRVRQAKAPCLLRSRQQEKS